MSITIKAKQVFRNGKKMIKILDVHGLGKKDLPVEYLAGESVFVESGVIHYKAEDKQRCWCTGVDALLPVKSMDEKIDDLNRCGEHLRKINKKIKENWCKIVTYTI